jgi:hypothetical protein
MMSSAGGRPSWQAMVSVRSFRRSARIPPAVRGRAGHNLPLRHRRSQPQHDFAVLLGLRGAGLRRSLGQRAFRLAGITPVDIGGVWLFVAAAHLVRCLLVVVVHETSYLARQHEPDIVAGCGVK